MSATMTSPTTRKSSCGCGGSGSKGTSCSCGSAPCLACENQGYTRPRFFAGQLLTEDDLQQLSDYVVAKNRLHNRYFVGSGVACGLDVICHPCGEGRVLVNPGYAVDCCGNDIVLTCPQELDINKMVRDLKLKLRGGFDCGDPCTKDQTATVQPNAPGAIAGVAGRGTVVRESDPKATSHKHRYCLYIRYCEQPSDPVSPYATDEPCGPQACEATRIREGFSFELRCPDMQETTPEICARFWDCIGDSTTTERSLLDAQNLRKYIGPVLRAAEAIRTKPKFEITDLEQYVKTLFTDSVNLTELQKNFKIPVPETDDPAKVQGILATLFQVGSHIAQFEILDDAAKANLPRKAATEIDDLRSTLKTTAEVIKKEADAQVHKAFPTALEYSYAISLFDAIKEVTIAPQAAAARIAAIPGPANPMELRFLAEGALFTRRFQSAAAESLEVLRNWSLAQLEKRPGGTHCNMAYKVSKVTLPLKNPARDDIEIADAYRFGNPIKILTRAVPELLRSCFCDALNPPCPSCDDTGVLLACLTVEDCQVKDICNLERQFVISPVNLRYWIPEIGKLGEAFEEWCCPTDCDDEDDMQTVKPFTAFPSNPYVSATLAILLAGCPNPKTSMGKIMTGTRIPPIPEIVANNFDMGLRVGAANVATIIGNAIPAMAASDSVAELIKTVEAMRGDIETLRNDNQILRDRMAKKKG